jgi:hypothetical protein
VGKFGCPFLNLLGIFTSRVIFLKTNRLYQSFNLVTFRIVLQAFYIYRTENILCESGFEDLMERRKRKIIEMALYFAEEAQHPMNQHLENRRAYDKYAERPKLTKPFFVRALEACSAMEMELSMVEGRVTPETLFWTNMSAENIITDLEVLE